MELVIIGAGGHGKVVAEIAKKNNYTIKGFIDDNPNIKNVGDYKVLGNWSCKEQYKGCSFFVAIGNNNIRKTKLEVLIDSGYKVTALIDPSAIVSTSVKLGVGSVVMPNSVINVDSCFGKGCIVNTASSIDHDCKIGDYVHICPGVHIAGTVSIQSNTWVGIGTSIINNLNIGENVMLGAGSVVVDDIPSNTKAYGIPAKVK